jgi:hypothetical protein
MPKSVPFAQYASPRALVDKIPWIGDHFGPGVGAGNYQQNGYVITPQSLGMSRIEWVEFSAFSQSGNYYARAIYPATSNKSESTPAPGFNSVTVEWFYAANNVQVANNTTLDGECVQMFAIGQ